jgi:chromosome segregation ATPase
MRLYVRGAAWALLGAATVVGLGCAQDVDRDDVTDARQEVLEEERETAQARQEMGEEVAEQERQAAEKRHEALRPDYEGVREADGDVREARREGAEKVREEEQETREARKELSETEAKFEAQKARDNFLAEPRALLKSAEERIEQLKAVADDQEGAAQEATQLQIDKLQLAHDALEEAIDDAKSADALDWQTEKATVDTAHKNLQRELDEAGAEAAPAADPDTIDR